MATMWTSADEAAQQGFDSNYYLTEKAIQLTATTGQTWTVESTAAALEAAGLEPYQHYQLYGYNEGLAPNAYFDSDYYVASKAAAAGVTTDEFLSSWNAISGGASVYFHYIEYGAYENDVNPSSSFGDYQYYVEKANQLNDGTTWQQVREIFQANGLTAISHYMLYGASEGLSPVPVGGATYSLTSSQDVATANVFNSVPAWSPGGNELVNTLQNFDVLTGTGTNPTLNVQLGDANDSSGTTISPTLNGIETINAAFIGSAGAAWAVNTLDMQDATGANSLNITRISDGNSAFFRNITSVPAELSLSNTNSPAGAVGFVMTDAAVAGDDDSTTMTLNNATVNNLVIQGTTAGNGVETVSLVSSTSANAVGTLFVDDIKVLNISGDQNLSVGDINYGAADGDFTTINGSAATGNLTLTINDNLNNAFLATTGSGPAVDFQMSTGSGDDTINVTTTAANGGLNGLVGNTGDVVDLGAGTDTVAFSAASDNFPGVTNYTFTNANSAVFNGVENATLTRTATVNTNPVVTPPVATNNTMTVDSAQLTGDQAFTLTNSGGNYAGGDGTATFVLNNLSATEAATGLTITHSSTSNNGLANNVVVANLEDGSGATDTVGLTLATGSNADPRFNVTLTAGGTTAATAVENVTVNASDGESNTVALTNFAQHTGTITVTGEAGQFVNLDANANATGAGFGIDTTGAAADVAVSDTYIGVTLDHVFMNSTAAADERLIASTIDATGNAGDTILRVGAANQDIQFGAGNDTVIFDALNDATAGLTILDSVSGGAGNDTVLVDGNFAGTIALGASEWTHLSGIDTIRLGINGAPASGNDYALTITDQLVGQTDDGNTLTVINNDGILGNNAESDLTLDLTSLSATKFVNFYGADGDSDTGVVQTTVNRVIMSDANANGGHILNGGDADLHTLTASPAFVANNNIYEVRDSAVVTTGDLAQVSNFGTIAFNNDQAVTQTLTLTLNDSVVDSMAQASHTAATTAGNVETLNIVANDGSIGSAAAAVLNVDASSVGAQFSLNITGDTAYAGNDIITSGAGDDILDGALGNDNITGNAGADVMTGGANADVFHYGTLITVAAQTGITLATADTISDFVSGTDTIQMGTAGTAANYQEGITAADFAAAQTAADTVMDGTVRYYLTDTAADGGLLFVDSDGNGSADAVIKLTGITAANFDFSDIVA